MDSRATQRIMKIHNTEKHNVMEMFNKESGIVDLTVQIKGAHI